MGHLKGKMFCFGVFKPFFSPKKCSFEGNCSILGGLNPFFFSPENALLGEIVLVSVHLTQFQTMLLSDFPFSFGSHLKEEITLFLVILHFGSPTGRTSYIWGIQTHCSQKHSFGGNSSILGYLKVEIVPFWGPRSAFCFPESPFFPLLGSISLGVTPKCPYFSPFRCPLRTHGRSSWSLLALWGAIGPRHRWRGHRTSTPWWMSRLTPRTSRANLKLSSPNSML